MFSSGCKMYASTVNVFPPYLKVLQESVQFGITLREKKSTLFALKVGFLTCFILAFFSNLKKSFYLYIYIHAVYEQIITIIQQIRK